ncbi:MAG: ribonuclease R family protein [Parachlamydiales bacterium]|jgi:ribonuclease R
MQKNIVEGILRTNPRGFGFVVVKDKSIQDVFIPKSEIKNAIEGDLVEVEIKQINPKGPEGKIIRILKRERKNLAGIILQKLQKNYLAYVPTLGLDWHVVVLSDKKLEVGDRLIIEPLEWDSEKDKTVCKMIKFLSNISDASKDTEAAIYEFEIKDEFSKEAISEAKSFKIEKNDLKNRKDLTDLNAITIDPTDAKDYDDAVSLTKDQNNHFHLGVHITDVAHYVKKNSFLDIEAKERGNSTYFPQRCTPMLPFELSNDLCSLKPDTIRLTVSVQMEFDTLGNLVCYDIERSYIESKKRFSYEEAKKVLDSPKDCQFKKNLQEMVELCLILKKIRLDRGSIDFSISESKLVLDKNGVPIEMKKIEYDITHQLIEEFMLKANEIVAKHLSSLGKHLIFRIHEEPSSEKFNDFFELARSLGFSLPQKPTQQDIQNLFVKAKETEHLQLLSISFIKNLKLAHYSPDNVGHFGLALEYYTHFTSPIRRYSDLIIQRILFNEEDENTNFDEVAKICSDKERNSFRAENSVITLKKLRLLQKIISTDSRKIFTAVVTKVKPFGIYFELDEYLVEGFLHVSEIEDDYYEYYQESSKLIGKHKNKTLSIGTKIKLKVEDIDLILHETTFRFIK